MALTAKIVFKVWRGEDSPPGRPTSTITAWGEPTYDLIGSTRFDPVTVGSVTYGGGARVQATFRMRRPLPADLLADDVVAIQADYRGRSWAIDEVLTLSRRWARITLVSSP